MAAAAAMDRGPSWASGTRLCVGAGLGRLITVFPTSSLRAPALLAPQVEGPVPLVVLPEYLAPSCIISLSPAQPTSLCCSHCEDRLNSFAKDKQKPPVESKCNATAVKWSSSPLGIPLP